MDGDRERLDARWQLVLPHRAALVRVARSRGLRADDAEACAHEAMLRCVEFDGLDEARVESFLVATTLRLCADSGRRTTRDRRLAAKLTSWHADQESPEDEVCARDEASWLVDQLDDLPQWQRDLLAARAEGADGQELARRFGVSYKSIESQLYRIRTRARGLLASTFAAALAYGRRLTPSPRVAVATTVAAAATVGVLMVTSRDGTAPAPATPVELVEPVAGSSATPVPVPAPTPRRAVSRPPGPGASATRPPSTSSMPKPTESCPLPNEATGCFSPNPTYAVNCVRNGIDTSQGLECRSTPTPGETP